MQYLSARNQHVTSNPGFNQAIDFKRTQHSSTVYIKDGLIFALKCTKRIFYLPPQNSLWPC